MGCMYLPTEVRTQTAVKSRVDERTRTANLPTVFSRIGSLFVPVACRPVPARLQYIFFLDRAIRRESQLRGRDDAVRFVFDPPREPFNVRVGGQGFERVALAFQFLGIDGGVNVPVARAAK